MQIIVILFIMFILFYLQSHLYSRYWIKDLSVDISFSSKSAFEGEKIYLKEIITNRKWMPLLWLRVKFQISKFIIFSDQDNTRITDDFYRNDLFSIMFYQRITKKHPVYLSKRGYYTIKSIDLISGDLFGFNQLAKQFNNTANVYVYPRLLDINDLEIPFEKIMGDVVTKRHIMEDPFEFRGIRDYSPFDSLKTINWNATARTGELKVNVNDYTSSQEIMILLNLQKERVWDDEMVMEESIRLAATFGSYFIEQGISVSLICNGRDLSTKEVLFISKGSSIEHSLNIYEGLARIDIDQSASAFIPILEEQLLSENREPLWILISHYHESDLQEKVKEIKESGYSLHWILPKRVYTDIHMKDIDNVHIWEVQDHNEQ